jgi:hypothetical protein
MLRKEQNLVKLIMLELEKLKLFLDLASAFGKPNPSANTVAWSRGRGVDFSHRVSLAEY